MSWSKTQNQMIHELNESVFSRDPINRIYDPMCPIDVQNTNYVMELKNREKYNPEDFDGSLIEKMKYDYLVNNCLLYTSPSPRDLSTSRMPSSA